MSTGLDGPMFEKDTVFYRSLLKKDGAHYNIYEIDTDLGMNALHEMFPTAECNDMNVVLFSTSGVHGMSCTLEEIERGMRRYPNGPPDPEEWPDDYDGDAITVLIVQPRIVCIRYGNVRVQLGDFPFLKRLRTTSHEALAKIGLPE